MNFHDKIVLVTGGTGGLGREVTMAFLEAGATVVVTYQIAEEFAAVVSAAQKIGATPPLGESIDVTDSDAVGKFTADLVAKHGRLDILVNTVGGYAGGTNLWEVDDHTYDKMLQLNLKAGFILARAVVPQMIKQNRGWIVNIASKAAFDHAAGAGLYVATKAAAVAKLSPGQLTLGADQTLALDTECFAKPSDRAAASAQLRALRGRTHKLHSAIAFVQDSHVLFEHVGVARLTMRVFSDQFLELYLDAVGGAATASVGGYQIEGLGIQLFERVEGDYFTVLGLPLTEALAFLRRRGCLAQ